MAIKMPPTRGTPFNEQIQLNPHLPESSFFSHNGAATARLRSRSSNRPLMLRFPPSRHDNSVPRKGRSVRYSLRKSNHDNKTYFAASRNTLSLFSCERAEHSTRLIAPMSRCIFAPCSEVIRGCSRGRFLRMSALVATRMKGTPCALE